MQDWRHRGLAMTIASAGPSARGQSAGGLAAARKTAAPRVTADGMTRLLVASILIASVFLSRFAFTLGTRELSASFVVTAAAVAALAACGRLRVAVPRLILFALAVALMLTAVMAGGSGRVSAPSFLLLVAMYLCFIFTIAESDTLYSWTLVVFRRICLIVAVAGIAQFLGQFAIPGPTLFTFRDIVPAQLLAQGYNPVIPVPQLWSLNKSNGFFLVEPSTFSQLMALALLVELHFFRISWRAGVLLTGLFLSFSGTGMLLAAVFGPVLLIRRNSAYLLLAACAAAVLAIVFADTLHIASITGRFSEFESTRSSAFARFLSPFYLFDDYVLPSLRNTLFGLGPGSIDPYFKATDYEIHDPTWGKLFFEYGMVGFLPFMAFVLCCLFVDTRSPWISAALLVNYLLLGGYLLDTHLQALILCLVTLHGAPRLRPAAARRRDPPWSAVPANADLNR
jgi:hypothetical protein